MTFGGIYFNQKHNYCCSEKYSPNGTLKSFPEDWDSLFDIGGFWGRHSDFKRLQQITKKIPLPIRQTSLLKQDGKLLTNTAWDFSALNILNKWLANISFMLHWGKYSINYFHKLLHSHNLVLCERFYVDNTDKFSKLIATQSFLFKGTVTVPHRAFEKHLVGSKVMQLLWTLLTVDVYCSPADM